MIGVRIGMVLVAFTLARVAFAQSSTADEIAKYREALQQGNPAELWEARGEELWRQKRGPKNGSLEGCDLGQGPGVVKGAYAHLPRYFADADKVMDVEQRLIYCMGTLQGIPEAEATKNHFGNGPGERSVMEALVAWIAEESRGVTIDVSIAHPKGKEAYELGRQMFFYRAGPYDFACATCHGDAGKRIRLQDLPDLLSTADARRAYATWPGYRVSQGEVRTMQHRLYDCYRQQRFPEAKYASDGITALTMFLAHNANGGRFDAPGLKR
jgi:L-cysteine S-thiosulfotransferase